jgi:membrane-bound metal-dependent hydrolase YbcI (DUF457 family)
VPVWLLWMKFPRRFDFVALTVGAVIPDVFEPFIILGLIDPSWPSPDRDWTHSLLGAVTLDAALALAATVLVARPLLAWADQRSPSYLWSHFAGHDFRRRTTWVTLLSVWIGTLSHALIDLPFHAAVRLFFPIGPELWLFPYQLQPVADLAANVLFAPLFLYLLYAYWWRPSRSGPRSTA